MNAVQPTPAAVDTVPEISGCGPLLHVDLGRIRANYLTARQRFRGRTLSAVVKSNAYGLGLDHIVPTLFEAGCRSFWVNDLEEAMRVSVHAPASSVYTLMGMRDCSPHDFETAGVVPALVTYAEVESCARHARAAGRSMKIVIQLDTGLGRLGLNGDEVRALAVDHELLRHLDIEMWVSHLASYSIPDDPANAEQRARLVEWLSLLPAASVSLSASSGVYMNPQWHFDVARVGSALFGVQTSVEFQNGLLPCYELSAPLIRIADFPAGRQLGYRGVTRLTRPSRIATVAIGYANGLPQSFAQSGKVRIGDIEVPLVGGIAMNMTMVDVTDLPYEPDLSACRAVFLNENQPIEAVAEQLGCAPNMLLTQIGAGTNKVYAGA